MKVSVEKDSEIGRFTEATDDGRKLLFGYPSPWSSYATIRLDDINYYQNSTMDSYVTQPSHIIGDSIVTEWELPGNVDVVQELSLSGTNAIKYDIAVTNNGGDEHSLNMRYMFDTMMGYNDGAPFRVPGIGDVTTEQEFVDPFFNCWKATEDLSDPEALTSLCSFDPRNTPDKVQFVHWPSIYGAPYEHEVSEGQSITSDTAVGMFWEFGLLVPGETERITVYYGLGGPILSDASVQIINLFAESEDYYSGQDVRFYTDIGNGSDDLFSGDLLITIKNADDQVVHNATDSLSIATNQIVSKSYSYDLPSNASSGTYTIRAEVEDGDGVTVDTKETSFSVMRQLSMEVSPGSITMVIGGTATYHVILDNSSDFPTEITLDLNGLDTGWYAFSDETLFLVAGEREQVSLVVKIPESLDAVGMYPFNVSGNSLQSTANLNVVADPVITDLSPPDSVTLSSRDVPFVWNTQVASTTEVFLKAEGEAGYTHLESPGTESNHLFVAANLERGTNYEWYARSATGFGSTDSEIRTFSVGNGIVFAQDEYNFAIARNYDQRVSIGVVNNAAQSYDLIVSAINVPDDLYAGFIGGGSSDETITLGSGETKQINLAIHAQDATKGHYSFKIQLASSDPQVVYDYAVLHIDVQQPNIDFTITEVGDDPISKTKTIRIQNNGDSLADLSVTFGGALKGYAFMQPSISHYLIGSGESVNTLVSPVWSGGIQNISGTIVASAAGDIQELAVDFDYQGSEQIFEVILDNPILYYDLEGEWCINAGSIVETIAFAPGFGEDNINYAYLGMELNVGSEQAISYDIDIAINDQQIGSINDTKPQGYYEYDIDPQIFNYAGIGIAENEFVLNTDMSQAYYTSLSDIRLVVCLDELNLNVRAESLWQAWSILWNMPFVHKSSTELDVSITFPADGTKINLEEPVQIKADVWGIYQLEPLCKVTAQLSNGDNPIHLVDNGKHGDGDAGDGSYGGTWVPQNTGTTSCVITIQASNCRQGAFTSANYYSGTGMRHILTINNSGSGSVIPSVGTYLWKYAEGEVIDLMAEPASGWYFDSWSGETNGIAETGASITTVTMNDNYSIVANFKEVPPVGLAIRSLPCVVNPGSQLEVSVEASGCGMMGSVTETLPLGFTYLSSSLDPAMVNQNGNRLAFVFSGDSKSFNYALQAPVNEGNYKFRGIARDDDQTPYTVGGNSVLVVGDWDPWEYDTDTSGDVSKQEALVAVVDFFGGQICKSQALDVIVLFFS